MRGGAVVIDKSDAYRLQDGIPLVVAGVNDDALDGTRSSPTRTARRCSSRARSSRSQEAAGLARVRLATYQSASGAGDAGIERLRSIGAAEGNLGMDWELDGEEFSEEWKLRAETRKILELPDLPLHATCVRVPVLVGHAQAVWVETESPLSPDEAREVLAASASVELADLPTPADAAGQDRCSSGASAGTRPATASRSGSSTTTCARARR